MRPRRGRVRVARRLADRRRDAAAGQVGERGRAQEPPVAWGARPDPQAAVVVARRQMVDGVAGRGRVLAPDAAAVQVAAIRAAAVPVVAVPVVAVVRVVVRVEVRVEAVVVPVAMEAGMPAATTIVVHHGAGQ